MGSLQPEYLRSQDTIRTINRADIFENYINNDHAAVFERSMREYPEGLVVIDEAYNFSSAPDDKFDQAIEDILQEVKS